jgi:dipeptidyl aminopeptidase/acylaminoacyl peptidase
MQAAAQAPSGAPAPAPKWQDYLKPASVENVQISPDGTHLAIAQRSDSGIGDGDDETARTVITVRNAATLAIENQLDSGANGVVGRLRWIDENRLLVSVNRVNTLYNVAFGRSVLAIVSRDGKSRYVLPASFLATIDGDPEHLLVARCTDWGKDGCYDSVNKVQIGHTKGDGEAIATAPDRGSELFADRAGHVRFAASVDDKANTRLQAYFGGEGKAAWTLLNDSEKTGVDVWPLGVDPTGMYAYIESEQKSGPSIVERYEFATNTRTQVYRHADSDVVSMIRAFDGETPIGAYYEPTAPKPVIFNPGHPDEVAMQKIIAAFPGRIVRVTSASRDGTKAVVYTYGARDTGTWFLFDRNANRASLIARARSWLPEAALPKTTAFTLTARDGLTLHGVLTQPVNGPERQLPMIVLPHGGPHGVVDTALFDSEAALLASQGYAVLRVNFRGSGGYGQDFEKRGWMQWGRAMQDDVTDATRWAIEQGIADPKRICLYGASYGGYAALMGAVREPTLYRCVAGYAAPYDLAKMYKWGSIRRSDLGLDYLAKVIGKDPVVLAERSPSKQAAAIKVPVFIAHGRADARVDVQHSRKMAKALRDAGVDVEFQEYAREGHGLNLEADELDFYARLLAFVGKHTAAP